MPESISGKWMLGEFLCILLGIFRLACSFIRVTCLLLLTVDRYVAIIHSLRYPNLVTLQRVKVIVALLWSLSLVMSVLLFGVLTKATINTDTRICDYTLNTVFKCMTICCLPIPLVIIIVLYIHILRVARRQARRIAAQNHVGNPADGQNAPQPVSTKGATTVIIITVTLVLCWTSAILVQILPSSSEVAIGLQRISFTAFLSNSWLNCLIYYWRNKELRQALHCLVTSCCP